MAGIQGEIDEYPRVLSDSVMLPRSYRVAETTGEDRIDRWRELGALQDWPEAPGTAHHPRTWDAQGCEEENPLW